MTSPLSEVCESMSRGLPSSSMFLMHPTNPASVLRPMRRSGLGWRPNHKPWFVSVDETPGTPMPGWAKVPSTANVTTFLAFTAEWREDKWSLECSHGIIPWDHSHGVMRSFLTVNVVPLPVAELCRTLWFEDCCNGTSAVVHSEGQSSVDHL